MVCVTSQPLDSLAKVVTDGYRSGTFHHAPIVWLRPKKGCPRVETDADFLYGQMKLRIEHTPLDGRSKHDQ